MWLAGLGRGLLGFKPLSPRSSGDRASPSGGESAGSNPAGGTTNDCDTPSRVLVVTAALPLPVPRPTTGVRRRASGITVGGVRSRYGHLPSGLISRADACYDRHRNSGFLTFLKQVAEAHPRVKLHVVADNYATPNHPNVKVGLDRNPRITMHFTPASASWINMVEIFFGIITRQAIRCGTFTSVGD